MEKAKQSQQRQDARDLAKHDVIQDETHLNIQVLKMMRERETVLDVNIQFIPKGK